MRVITKYCGVVLRLVIDRTFGIRLHAIHEDSEMIVELKSLRVIQSDAPPWVHDLVLWWVEHHQDELIATHKIDFNLATPISRQATEHLVFAD